MNKEKAVTYTQSTEDKRVVIVQTHCPNTKPNTKHKDTSKGFTVRTASSAFIHELKTQKG